MSPMDRIIGMSADVLTIRAQRMTLISSNLANADTPGYKAVDIDFQQALQRARTSESVFHGRAGHQPVDTSTSPVMQYRTPSQVSLDGNTVETDLEHAAFMDNAIRYQASLNFLDGRIKSIMTALRGE